jgi:acyl-coenzyme A synthetase/AMP-(fatty) acid ligase
MNSLTFSKIRYKILKNLENENGEFIIDSYGTSTSFSEFHRIVRNISVRLPAQSRKIVILAEKNAMNYAAILATVLSGRTWIPISEIIPVNAIEEILLSCEPDIVLVSKNIAENKLNTLTSFKDKTIILEDLAAEWAGDMLEWPTVNSELTAIIYHTSGSTGRPKGVEISFSNLSAALLNTVYLYADDELVWGDYHDLSFVISINIFFSCLYSNGRLFCANDKLDQISPARSIVENKVECLVTVPSTLSRLTLDSRFTEIFKFLKTIVSCGEPFPLTLLEYFVEYNRTKIFNFYGSTELSTWVFYHRCRGDDLADFSEHGHAPLGKVIPGNKFCISDDNLLLVSGPQVCKGYLNFEPSFHLQEYGKEHWFSTGDIVGTIKGEVVCKGRADHQVKLNGFRLHPMEIETKLMQLDDIEGCLCFLDTNMDKPALSCGLIAKKALSREALIEFLKICLPRHMIPTMFYLVPQKPINKNGKIDKVKLKEMCTYANILS